MIEQGLYELITTDSGITSLATGGVYWMLAPKGAAVPYIILSRVATGDTYDMAGATGLRDGLFQVDCYASGAGNVGYYQARAMAVAVRELLESYKGTLPDTDSTIVDAVFTEKDWDMPYEEGAKGFVYRALLEFRIWHNES